MFRTLLVVCLVFLLPNSVYAFDACDERHCIAVVDAGSTGSRLHVYAYDLDGYQEPTQISEIWSHAVKPGFSSIPTNQADINAYLSTLFSGMPQHDISVYFYSTAGMRILPKQKQVSYYAALKNWFAEQPNLHLVAAKTITGRDEGVLGWLAVNYRLQTQSGDENSSVGMIDIGGASTQIVFPTSSTKPNEDEIKLKWHGRLITLFSHSFLGLGQNLVMQQFLNKPACFSSNYQLPDGLLGLGDATLCEQDIATLINGVHGVKNKISAAVSKNPPTTWYAMGAVPYLLHDGLVKSQDEAFSNAWLLNEVDAKACQVSWNILQKAESADGQLFSACLRASYYYALMVDGYGLLPDETIHVFPNTENIDWSIGVVLHQP